MKKFIFGVTITSLLGFANIVNANEQCSLEALNSNIEERLTTTNSTFADLDNLDKLVGSDNSYKQVTQVRISPELTPSCKLSIDNPYATKKPIYTCAKNVWYNKEVNMGHTTNCMISTQASSRNSNYADVISILTPMYIDELSAWLYTLPEQRGEEYKAFKKEKATQLLDFIKIHGIDFTDHIETMYTTTPLSYRDFTGTCDGSAYGIIKDYKCPQIGFVSTRTKLKNLFLTGQNLNVHGALGVTLTSIITCGEFVGHEYLAKKIGNA